MRWRWKPICARRWTAARSRFSTSRSCGLPTAPWRASRRLLRWRHPAKGLIAPADFIAHSEETGLIVALGRFALERAADDLAHWQRYFPLTPPLFVSVNLSRRQLRDPGFEELLSETVHKPTRSRRAR